MPVGRSSSQDPVVIVGSGPSGAVAAVYLAARGFPVVCLEQGDWAQAASYPGNKPEYELLIQHRWHHDPNVRDTAADYPLDNTDADLSPVMYAGVGGSSLMFGACWMRLLPSDFRVRTLDGVGVDWPITYSDLEPYYDRVDRFVGVAGVEGDPAYPPGLSPTLPPLPIGQAGRRAAEGMNRLGWHWWPAPSAIASEPYRGRARCARWGTCESGCPEGAKASFDLAVWPTALEAGATLITGARVRQIELGSSGLAEAVVYVDRQGVERRQRCSVLILAANAIGTTRLLLLSACRGHPDGLANSSGLVGRNLMLHPNADVVGVYDVPLESWLGPAGQLIHSLEFYETHPDRDFVRGGKWQVAPFWGPVKALELYAGRGLTFEQRWGEAAHDLVRSTVGRAFAWGVNTEDLPETSNTVTLSPDLADSDGIPAPKISYRISDNTRRLIRFHLDRIREAHEAAGAVRTLPTELVLDQPGHLLGTARMGDEPATSVVNSYGAAHDVRNLRIIDGSIFPTAGAMNPTSTITALALRCVEELADGASDQEVPL
jgi:choline dehydrogenase-like flavoprotein